jgi:GNAT superfamily N-acetyltransferase
VQKRLGAAKKESMNRSDPHEMKIEASGIPGAALIEYARIPIVFEVNAVLDVDDQPTGGGFTLSERRIQTPYLKDYDEIAETPPEWPRRFDTSKWGLMIVRIDDQCVGGVTVAYDTPGLDILEGRSDLAVLWDIRVAPEKRRHGIGGSLFQAAEAWAVVRGCRHLKVETQNINVAACRFYARHGCGLRAAHPGVYPECPDEVQLLWYKDLDHQ